MKRLTAAAMCAMLSACAATGTQKPLTTLAQARASYIAACAEIARLRDAGVELPAARQSCITADDVLDAADLAYKAGRLAEASSGAQKAMIYITAAQAAVAVYGKAK